MISKLKNKRLTELLNLKDEQIEHTRRNNTDSSSVDKYKLRLKELEVHYERKIADLVEELHMYKKSSQSKSNLKSERTKSSRSIRKTNSKTRKEHLMTNSTFGKGIDPEISYREDVDLDTDMTPAEELNSTDRRKIIEKVENRI